MPQQANPIRHFTRSQHRTKPCPFCAEDIRYKAIKCRFCGEFLYGDRSQTQTKFGPPEAEPASTDSQRRSPEQDQEDEVLWFGRPSIFAMTGTVLKAACFIALCTAAYVCRVTSLATYLPSVNPSDVLLTQIETYVDLGAMLLILATVLILFAKIIILKSIYYEVTPDRIEWSRGIIDRRVDNLDMFRIIDLKLRRSLWECLVGIGTVTLMTKDETDPKFDFIKVRYCRDLYDIIKEAGLEADNKRNVIHLE